MNIKAERSWLMLFFPNCTSMKTFSFLVTSAVLMLLLAAGYTSAYKPVILVHGVLSGPSSFKNLTRFIKKAHPGTEVTAIDLFNNEESTEPMWEQIDGFAKVIQEIMDKSPEGVHLLCYSQGGLICRGVLSKLPNHNVQNFIALSSPLAGQFGVTEMLHEIIPVSGRKLVYLLCYRQFAQMHISICNYWNDPLRRVKYLKFNNFLPLLNGEKAHGKMAEWKKNFLRIKKLVLIGGPDDDVITPWQSSQFGFYNNNETIIEMRKQMFYRKNTFGLKTLDTRGDLIMCTRSGVKHTEWHSNKKVFKKCIQKWFD
ncbi:lysosomal thioesterase PPT2-B [Oryzias melastigma]|uniref:palmitoyl-CoA hydrolase n=1 Tax=Oryzias melastigma TaxID=30732 RepID=A0A3B3CHV9_ORYME|nr:lysosomal thioesterase PPT2-B [Oryzias melastigma]